MKNCFKIRILLAGVIIAVCFTGCTYNNKSNSTLNNDTQGIYILYKDETTRIKYLTENFEELSDIKVPKGWDLCSVGKNKVYLSIAGDADSVGKSLKVLKAGKVIKEIPLKYDMPMEIKYNQYNEYAYVAHTYKLTYNKENCISVIDTKNDKEIYSIMYDEVFEDVAFSPNDLMFVSSTDAITPENNLDVFNTIDNKMIKHIPLDVRLHSIVYSPETKLIYGVQDSENDPILFAVDWEKGKIIDRIKLNYNYPCQLTLDNKNGKELIYISNVYIDNANEGHVITIFDPKEKKIIKEITNAYGIHDYAVDNNIYVVARCINKAYMISKDDKIIKKIEIPFPVSITKAY